VFGSGATALLDRDNKLVALTNRLASQAFGAGKVRDDAFELSAREAVAIGYRDMTGEELDPGLFRALSSKGEYVEFGNLSIIARKSPYVVAPTRAKKVFFPSEMGLIPAWYVEVMAKQPERGPADSY